MNNYSIFIIKSKIIQGIPVSCQIEQSVVVVFLLGPEPISVISGTGKCFRRNQVQLGLARDWNHFLGILIKLSFFICYKCSIPVAGSN